MAEQNPGLVDVSAGAGALDFPTTQAAQAAGKANGAKALQAIEDHGNDDFILTELEQYADDPAYMAASLPRSARRGSPRSVSRSPATSRAGTRASTGPGPPRSARAGHRQLPDAI